MLPKSPPHETASRPSALSWQQRLLGLSWRRQSTTRQDRFATFGPLLSVLLFQAAIISAFWYLRNEEIERETDSVKRDAELTQQQISLRLLQNQEALVRISREVVSRSIDADEFVGQATTFLRQRPELTYLAWLDAARRPRAAQSGLPFDIGVDNLGARLVLPVEGTATASELAFRRTRDVRTPVYSRAFNDAQGGAVFQLHIPLIERGGFSGVLMAEYSIADIIRHHVPADVAKRHAVAIIDEQQRTLAATVTTFASRDTPRNAIVSEAPLTPVANGLVLRAQGYRTSIGLISNTLFWMVVALSGLAVWMLFGTWRHMRRRAQIQVALVQETNFRRAIENSMPTGMRAMDLDGRITYVNAAFCQMTGFPTAELVGRLPPYPYWPPERIEENGRLLQQELAGRSPADGIKLKVMRKDGSVFDVRTYASPLNDPQGQQTGWMTSMTNVIETKRDSDSEREELRDNDVGHGGYIVLDLHDDHKAMFHDVLKGFEEFAKLKGYSISFSVDGSVPNKIAFKFTVLPSSTPVTTYTVQDDLKEYIRRVQSGDVDLSDLPRLIPWEQHEALLLAMRNRIIFLQHTYRAQRNVLDFYERVLKDANPLRAGIAPAQTFYLQAGGDMSPRNYTALGSNRVVQGDNNEVDQSVHVARSFNEKKQQLDNLDQLIAALAQAALGDPAKKAVISLEKVKDELTLESTPDESRIKRWLDMAKDSMKALALGKDVVELASKTFESFNISF